MVAIQKECQMCNTQMAAGNFQFNQCVYLTDSHLPEFSCTLCIKSMAAYIFDAPCKYDMIIGCNWLVPNKFDISFSTGTMNWFNCSIPMKPASTTEMFFLKNHDDMTDDPLFDLYMTQNSEILPAKYDEVFLDKVVAMQDHLSDEQKTKLCSSLEGNNQLFKGKLGVYPGKKIHLDLKPGTKLHHA
jgi:hypothetical protein